MKVQYRFHFVRLRDVGYEFQFKKHLMQKLLAKYHTLCRVFCKKVKMTSVHPQKIYYWFSCHNYTTFPVFGLASGVVWHIIGNWIINAQHYNSTLRTKSFIELVQVVYYKLSTIVLVPLFYRNGSCSRKMVPAVLQSSFKSGANLPRSLISIFCWVTMTLHVILPVWMCFKTIKNINMNVLHIRFLHNEFWDTNTNFLNPT